MPKSPIALRSAHTVLPVCLVKQLKCLVCSTHTHTRMHAHTHMRARTHIRAHTQACTRTHTHTHTSCSSSSFIVTLSLIQRTACARVQFSRCSLTTYAHSETGQMAVCCQNLVLGALCSHSTLSVLVGALFKKFGIFLNMPHIYIYIYIYILKAYICRYHKLLAKR